MVLSIETILKLLGKERMKEFPKTIKILEILKRDYNMD